MLLTVSTAAALLAIPSPALAHGIGGRQDLPVPLSYFVAGAGVALVISFVALSSRWREPRLQDGPRDQPVKWAAISWFYRALPWLGGLGFVLVLLGGIINGSASRNNVAPVLVWVDFWLLVPFAGVIFGDLWRWMSPFQTITRWVNADRPERPELLDEVGYWPATLAFIAFTWLELVSPDSSFPRTLAIAVIVYTLYKVPITAWAGPETGTAVGGAFANYSALLGSIAPISADRGGAIVVRRRGWLRALPAIAERPGLVAFVVAMIGTVSYDGMSSTGWWRDLWQGTARETWFGTLALVVTVLIVGGVTTGRAGWRLAFPPPIAPPLRSRPVSPTRWCPLHLPTHSPITSR